MKNQTWKQYKRLTHKPDQNKARSELREAITKAAKAIMSMIDSERKEQKDLLLSDAQHRYAFAMYYFNKYLLDTPEFDDKANPRECMEVYLLFRRGNKSPVFLQNTCWAGRMGTQIALAGLLKIVAEVVNVQARDAEVSMSLVEKFCSNRRRPMPEKEIRLTDDLTKSLTHERPRPQGSPPVVHGSTTRKMKGTKK